MFHPRNRMVTVRLALGWLVVAHSVLAGAHWHLPTSDVIRTAEVSPVVSGPSCGCHHGSADVARVDALPSGPSEPIGEQDSTDQRDGQSCPESDDCAVCRAALQSAEISPPVVAQAAWQLTGRLDGGSVMAPNCPTLRSYLGRAPPLG